MIASKIKQLVDNGLCLDDICSIIPYQGRRREFVLNRSLFEISLKDNYRIEKDHYNIFLPSLSNEDGSFSLKLVSLTSGNSKEERQRFLLESSGENLFKVNGSYVFKCILQKGDIVDIGYNRIYFGISLSKNADESLFMADRFLKNKITRHNINIVIEGETGTGKSRLAKKIHENSGRIGNFVHLNLSAFSRNLIESELFGHIKGAFTGAHRDKKGAILEANYGTLFLDEIDSLPLDVQTKLLLFLDSKTLRPVGGSDVVKADVRLIFASGRKLKNLIKNNQMRKDFYFRLISGAMVTLPSLKEKPDMIDSICCDYSNKNNVYISKKLIDFYKNISWPGNVRQLLGHLEKKKILSVSQRLVYDEIDRELIGDNSYLEDYGEDDLFKPFLEVKRDYFTKVFMYYEKNYLLASKILGVTPQTLKTTINYPASKECI